MELVQGLLASVQVVGDGSLDRVPITFEMSSRSYVVVYLDDDLLEEGWSLTTYDEIPTVLFDKPIPYGKIVTVRRRTRVTLF